MHEQKQNLGNWITSVHLPIFLSRVRFPIKEIYETDFDWIILIFVPVYYSLSQWSMLSTIYIYM